MTPDDLVFVHAPVMTAAHAEAMRLIDGHYPFADTLFPRYLIGEIHAHLEALLAHPVPHTLTPYEVITHASNYVPPGDPSWESWLHEYSHLNDDECQSDQ